MKRYICQSCGTVFTPEKHQIMDSDYTYSVCPNGCDDYAVPLQRVTGWRNFLVYRLKVAASIFDNMDMYKLKATPSIIAAVQALRDRADKWLEQQDKQPLAEVAKTEDKVREHL